MKEEEELLPQKQAGPEKNWNWILGTRDRPAILNLDSNIILR